MSQELEAEKNYKILDDDYDVLLFDKGNTCTVSKFKELITSKLSRVLITGVQTGDRSIHRTLIQTLTGDLHIDPTIIPTGSISWNSPKEGIDCQFLKVGSKGWQKGKFRIEASIDNDFQFGEMKICIKFCLDRPPEIPLSLEPESPLDEIRQSAEYKNL